MAGKFDLKKTPKGKFMFNLKAGNGQVILTSEMYDSKPAAKKGIAAVQKNAANDKRYERKTSKKGQPYFVLKSGNSQVIGKSAMYASVAGMENGVASVKTNGPAGAIADNT
ncbi:MAG: YegP family protein [Pseudomonadota bacterium]